MKNDGLREEYRVVKFRDPKSGAEIFHPMCGPSGFVSKFCTIPNREKGTKEQQAKMEKNCKKEGCEFYCLDPSLTRLHNLIVVSPRDNEGKATRQKINLFKECRERKAERCVALVYSHLRKEMDKGAIFKRRPRVNLFF